MLMMNMTAMKMMAITVVAERASGVGDNYADEHCNHEQEKAGPDPHQQICAEAVDHDYLPPDRERPAKLLGDDATWPRRR